MYSGYRRRRGVQGPLPPRDVGKQSFRLSRSQKCICFLALEIRPLLIIVGNSVQIERPSSSELGALSFIGMQCFGLACCCGICL